MRSLLIDENDEIVVHFVIAWSKDGRNVRAEVTRDDLQALYGDTIDDSTIQEHTATFRRPSFGDTVRMSQNVYATSDGLRVDFNPYVMRMGRLSSLIKSWTLADGEGNPIPATPESVAKVDPVVAQIIGIQLDAEIGTI